MKIIEKRPREIDFVLWDHCQNLLDDPRRLVTVVTVNDRFVYVWDTTTRRILYKLPGHAGSVNDVDFHPEEPIG